MKIDIGIVEKNRAAIAGHLNNLLSSEYALYTKSLKYHWNVVGVNFGPLHALFKDNYEGLLTFADTIAERVRALGFHALGTLSEFSKHSEVKEEPGKHPDDKGMIANMVSGHETIIKQMRTVIDFTAKINDAGTNNMLCDMIEQHEKMAWMLRAHLEK